MIVSGVLSAVFSVIGLWFSYALNLTSGATIIAVAGIGFLISLGIERLWPNIAVK